MNDELAEELTSIRSLTQQWLALAHNDVHVVARDMATLFNALVGQQGLASVYEPRLEQLMRDQDERGFDGQPNDEYAQLLSSVLWSAFNKVQEPDPEGDFIRAQVVAFTPYKDRVVMCSAIFVEQASDGRVIMGHASVDTINTAGMFGALHGPSVLHHIYLTVAEDAIEGARNNFIRAGISSIAGREYDPGVPTIGFHSSEPDDNIGDFDGFDD